MNFMPQDVFDACSLLVARVSLSGMDERETAATLAKEYRRTYRDEGLVQEFIVASAEIKTALSSLFADKTDSARPAACKSISQAMQLFESDGRRKRKLFKGALFSRQRAPITNKVEACRQNVIAYHFAIITGAINPADLK